MVALDALGALVIKFANIPIVALAMVVPVVIIVALAWVGMMVALVVLGTSVTVVS